MLVIQTVLAMRRLPLLMLLGLLVMAVGGVLDVVMHLGSGTHGSHPGLWTEHLAHTVGIAGMTLVLVEVVVHGARRQRRPRAARTGGLETHAHR